MTVSIAKNGLRRAVETGNCRAECGSIAVFLVITMPLLIILAGLVIDIGTLFCANSLAYAAADMAALAAVQDLDLQMLAEGKRQIMPDAATRDAEAFLAANILKNWPGLAPEDIAVAVTVYNVESGGADRHAFNGRHLSDPTVCVRVTFPVKLRFISAFSGTVSARAHADASVVRK